MKSINEANLSHILGELTRISVLISANIFYWLKTHDKQQTADKQSSAQLLGIPSWATQKTTLPGLEEKITGLRHEIDAKIESNSNIEECLRLLKLKRLFDLSAEEINIFLICLIEEFEARYQVLWVQLQNNPDEKYPSIDTILNLLSSTLTEKLKLWGYLQNGSKLFKYNLLEPADANSYPISFTLKQAVKVNPRILSYLLCNDNITPHLSPMLRFLRPIQLIDDLYLPEDFTGQIDEFVRDKSQTLFTSTPSNTSIISLRGKESTEQQIVAGSICHRLRINMLIADIDSLLTYPLAKLPSILSSVQLEAILQNAAIYWKNTHLLSISGKENVLHLFVEQLNQFQGLHFIALGPSEYFPFHETESTLLHLDIPNLTTGDRFKLWQRLVPDLPSSDIAEIAQSFQIGRGQIYDIATHIKALFKADKGDGIDDSNSSVSDSNSGNNNGDDSNSNNGDGNSSINSNNTNAKPSTTSYTNPSKEQVYEVCHTHAYRHLSRYAKLAKPLYKLENIILPEECKQELEEIISWMKYRETVYEHGGFNQKVSLGKGLITMFFGQPGTGKTMAAEVIAGVLNLLLYKIDLPSVLSKWVGETEQHLDKVFSEAENSNAILFFDEADSLFGKRGEVQDARDNYANIQTSYLLQKVEEYSGMVILSTNFKNNIDAAFIRRLHFSIEFPLPDSKQREAIWRQIWPQNVLLSSEINLQKLADKVSIAGGNIKNIALAATFKAVADQTIKETPIRINKDHIIFAIKRELRKTGRIIMTEQLSKIFEG